MSRSRAGGILDGLIIVWAMSLAFLVFSYVRIIGDAGSTKFGIGVLEAVLAEPIWGTRLAADLVRFGLALILLHSLAALVAWFAARLTLIAWPDSENSQRVLAIFWFAVFVVWIMAANAYWFPRTSLGNTYDQMVKYEFAGVTPFLLLSVACALGLMTVVVLAAVRRSNWFVRTRNAIPFGVGLLGISIALPALSILGDHATNTDTSKPHILVIGIDSLRTDFVRNSERQITPAIDEFLDHAVSFSDAYTPLARTFPAWVSLVSGRHPHTTGAIVNLLPRQLIDEGDTLPRVLGENGYRTIYAIDEVRFSNLDLSYGFDEMLAPGMGAADFLLGFFADTPLANLAVNTVIGKWLFPYGYANRAAADTYNPDTFIDRIEAGVDFDQPTMLAVHFTLAHWPYTWADSPFLPPAQPGEHRGLVENARLRYPHAVARVDGQFSQLMSVLERKGALENSIIFVLSDHGESLGERSPIAGEDDILHEILGTRDGIVGHGTHVFSKDQYNVLLALRSYGSAKIQTDAAADVSYPVSLLDVTPTILDALDFDGGRSFDGRSLMPFFSGDAEELLTAEKRMRFLETEFNPPGLFTDGAVSASAVSTAADKYSIDPESGLVLVRPDFIDEIMAQRQYAVEFDGDILATVPAAGNYRQQHLIHFDSKTGRASWLSQPLSYESDPQRFEMWQALEQRFEQVRNRPVVPLPTGVSTESLDSAF